jgi:hypothetical protein
MSVALSLVFTPLIATGSPGGMTPQQSLTLSLTAESLMFAAFAVSYNLAQPTEGGRHPFYAMGWFAYLIACAIAAAAVSAGASWYAIFQHDWPTGVLSWMRAGGVAGAFILQPFFAAAIAHQARHS